MIDFRDYYKQKIDEGVGSFIGKAVGGISKAVGTVTGGIQGIKQGISQAYNQANTSAQQGVSSTISGQKQIPQQATNPAADIYNIMMDKKKAAIVKQELTKNKKLKEILVKSLVL